MDIPVDVQKKLDALKKPFPEECIGLKPEYAGDWELDTATGQSYIPAENYQRCPVCGKVHALPAYHYRYVSHAYVTERLNEVDPYWTWTPMGIDSDGLPVIKGGELWGYLTVCGITRIGVGDAEGRTNFNAIKEMIGDSIRNAAMRFGCGLHLWQHTGEDDLLYAELPTPKTTLDANCSNAGKSAKVAPQMLHDAPQDELSADCKESIEIEINRGSTKAQGRLADLLEAIQSSGYEVCEAISEIEVEYGRPYHTFNKLEVEGALEYLEGTYPDALKTDSEVIPV